jgi:hypothetical protein
MAAYPVYFVLGQESLKGSLDEGWITSNADAQWTGAEASVDMYDYQAAAVDTYNTTPASANSNTQQVGDVTDIGLDVSAMRYLLDNDHAAGVAFSKRTDQGAVGGSGSNRWAKTHGESYANIDESFDALTTLIEGRGDTVDVKGFFLAFGYEEGVLDDTATDAAFLADLTQLILDLRTDYGAEETPVVLDLPPASVSGFTAGQNASLVNARLVIKQVAAADANVSYVSSDLLQRSNGSTKWHYTGEATIAQGTAMAKEMSRLVTGKGNNAGTGAPVYILLGDDNCVGSVAGTFLNTGADEDYDDPLANVKTWNWSNSTWEALKGDTNSNTSTDGTSNFGPDVSMGLDLAAQHPGETVYIFKLGRNTSSVGNTSSTGGSWRAFAADIYSEVVTAWNLAKTALDSVEAVVPDLRGLAIIMGQEDVATQALADAFLGNLRGMIDDYRLIFQTRVTGEPLGVVVAQMQDTGFYTTEYVTTVRDAVPLAAEEDGRVSTVIMDSLRTNSDQKTLSGGGTLELGKLLATGFAEINA